MKEKKAREKKQSEEYFMRLPREEDSKKEEMVTEDCENNTEILENKKKIKYNLMRFDDIKRLCIKESNPLRELNSNYVEIEEIVKSVFPQREFRFINMTLHEFVINKLKPIFEFQTAQLLKQGNKIYNSIKGIYEFPTKGVYFVKAVNERYEIIHWLAIEKKTKIENIEKVINFCIDCFKDCYSKKEHTKKQLENIKNKIILPEKIKESIFNEFDVFLKSKQEYNKLQMPWKRGIFLYGPPGNGKTMLIRTLCDYFGLRKLNIKYSIGRDGSVSVGKNLGDSKMSSSYPDFSFLDFNDEAEKRYAPNVPMVYYIEDIDKAIPGMGTGNINDFKLSSLFELLNGLDGVVEREKYIVIATANNIEGIYDAILSRPGRFDSIYNIELPTIEQITELLKYYGMKIGDNIAKQMKDNHLSMAFMVEFIKCLKFQHKTNEPTTKQVKEVLDKLIAHVRLSEKLKVNKVGFENEE